MATGPDPDADADAVLSDVDDDDNPITTSVSVSRSPSPDDDLSPEKFREIVSELDRERQSRLSAENSKAELLLQFNRLKGLAHEAIKKRDECSRQRDEALLEKEEAVRARDSVFAELDELRKEKEEILVRKEDAARQLEEVGRIRDNLRTEIETSAHMLVTGIEKISGKVSNFKNFAAMGLPRSQKYTGLPAVAYGVIKRTNEIVEETVRQVDVAIKSRNEAREQVEQRNYEIAIEVSQLEAAISGLRAEVARKSNELESLGRKLSEKDAKAFESEKEMLGKFDSLEKENSELKDLVVEFDDKVKSFESRVEAQRPLLVEQLDLVSRIHQGICDVIKVVNDGNTEQLEFSESLFLPQDIDVEESLHALLAGMKSIGELMKVAVENTKHLVEAKNREAKGLNETVERLVKEKEQIGYLLRGALSKRIALDASSKADNLFQAAENGLKNAGIDFKFRKVGDRKLQGADVKIEATEAEEDEVKNLAVTLENIVKVSQLEIIDLRHTIDELRAELGLLKERAEAQEKELGLRRHQIEELEEKERVANESIEGLMMDIATAEEEIARWKVAAEQEADAGKSVEQEFSAQVSGIKQELEEAKQALLELEKKLKFKEETADAAMAARDAAEKSLRLADLRASRLRDRVEELTRQLEESETRGDSRRARNGARYVCWPWQWLGIDFVGFQRSETPQPNSNEMELSEPLL
ncbi:hypothetical protein MLD38_008439 [Melastoma candidum]|uniref:Uncharacterized protein n=1 Tax=Melastoma candidum TaxID=119954 RepID=A0ACB9RUB1_9MYRT|nr:hypothetical protein MLD38_008439 [Melastoma candidum]